MTDRHEAALNVVREARRYLNNHGTTAERLKQAVDRYDNTADDLGGGPGQPEPCPLPGHSGHRYGWCRQEWPTDAPESILSASDTSADHSYPDDPSQDVTAQGEFPPLGNCGTAGNHLADKSGRCVRCGAEASAPPPLDIRDAPASYTTEPPQ